MVERVRRSVTVCTAVLLLAGGAAGATPSVAAEVSPDGVDPASIAVTGLPRLDPATVAGAPERRQAVPPEFRAKADDDFPGGCTTSGNDGGTNENRHAGEDRYQTAVCTSWGQFANHGDPNAPDSWKARAVVLARGDHFADALAGGPLAAHLNAPLLLTKPARLPYHVNNEIVRVLPRNTGRTVYLLGSRKAISDGVKSELESLGYRVKRLAGSNRYQTAIRIAEELPDTSNFFFTTGRDFPDALPGGNAAAGLTWQARLDEDPDTRPFALLLTRDGTMPATVHDFVLDRGQQFSQWSLVSVGAPADRAAVDAFGAGSLALRLVGANRYETAALVAEAVFLNDEGYVEWGVTGLATGVNFPDALAAPNLLADFPAPLLLTTRDRLPVPSERFLRDHAGGVFLALDVFGSEKVVSDEVMRLAAEAYWPF